MPSSLRCPGCGAPADSDAARCDYCGAALATVTCASCFAPMFAGSRFCAHCGAEATREHVDEGNPLKCPRCREDMQALHLGTVTARECAQCGGLWLDPESVQALANAREESAGVVSALAARVPLNATPPDIVRYVPCPRCEKLMNRSNFARSSGVILDVCKAHGVWLDRGELQRVIHFVESGGLTVAREREREELIEEQRRLAAMQGRGDRMGGAGMSAFPMTPGMTMRVNSSSAAPETMFDRLLRDALGVVFG
jgi:Zn-finger nucleic acid-binding protein